MTDTLERRIYEKGYAECDACGCLRRRSGMMACSVREGDAVVVRYRCEDVTWCAQSLAVREAGARKEMQG